MTRKAPPRELLRCPVHEDYKGRNQPGVSCLRCWRMFMEYGPSGDDDTGHVGVYEMTEILAAIEHEFSERMEAITQGLDHAD